MTTTPLHQLRAPEPDQDDDGWAVWDGLLRPLPTIEPRFFYDDHGSELFERITGLSEYYQTRTELALLESIASEIIDVPRPRELVELGAGAGRKIHLLLEEMRLRELLSGCVLLDINETFVMASAERLAGDFPEARVRGVVGDFTRDLAVVGPGPRRLLAFFAGTIGNLHPATLPAFLRMVRSTMAPDDRFLVGLDFVKCPHRLEAAYNDAAGVAAEFNRNILRVLNARFGADFDPQAYEHLAFWDPRNSWIEMRLRATRPMRVTRPGDPRRLVLEAGDEIRTELSCKFTRASFAGHLEGTGLEVERWWTDPEELFALALARPEAER